MVKQRTKAETCDHIFLPEKQVAAAQRLLQAVAACHACGMSMADIRRVVRADAVRVQKET